MEERKVSDETYLATKAHSAQTRTWIYEAYVDAQWPSRSQGPQGQRPLELNHLASAFAITRHPPLALKRAYRLCKNSDFQRVRQQGRTITSRLLVLAWHKNNADLTVSRIGFVISKRISKHAVTRNYIKRLLGETMRPFLADLPPGFDLVISAKNQIVTLDPEKRTQLVAPSSVITLELTNLLSRSHLLASLPLDPEARP